MDPDMVSLSEEFLHKIVWEETPPPAIQVGPFVTVQQCSGVTVAGREISARFNGICENMEGAAAAHICTMYEVPFLEIRCISNLVEDRNMAAWDLPLSTSRIQTAISEIVPCVSFLIS